MKKKLLFIFLIAGIFLPYLVLGQSDISGDFDEFDSFEEEFDDGVTGDQKVNTDPLHSYNRFMFKVNDKLYFWILKPVAKGYSTIVPEKLRLMIRRFFKNIGFPIRVVNNILQWKLNCALIETERFLINSTLGILGFFDPAKREFNLDPSKEDFGQTLGTYGVGEGYPVVLPFFGFSNIRDALSMIPDYFLNPVSYGKTWEFRTGLISFDKVNFISLNPELYEKLKNEGLDPYTFLRDLYGKDRTNKIRE